MGGLFVKVCVGGLFVRVCVWAVCEGVWVGCL